MINEIISKVIDWLLAHPTIPLILIFGIIVAMGIYIIARVIISETKRKKFCKTMKAGDIADAYVGRDGYVEGKIIKIDNETVIMSIKAHKNRLYPVNNENNQ